MKTLKISTKIALLSLGLIAAGIGLATFLLVRSYDTKQRYVQLRNDQYEPKFTALELEGAFKQQVQEWKNILLRGHDPKDLEEYKTKFLEAEPKVRAAAAKL